MSLGYYRSNKKALLADAIRISGEAHIPLIGGEVKESLVLSEVPLPALSATLTQSEQARSQGYTGDQCSNCNSMRMRISGHCYVCDDCGTTTGCS